MPNVNFPVLPSQQLSPFSIYFELVFSSVLCFNQVHLHDFFCFFGWFPVEISNTDLKTSDISPFCVDDCDGVLPHSLRMIVFEVLVASVPECPECPPMLRCLSPAPHCRTQGLSQGWLHPAPWGDGNKGPGCTPPTPRCPPTGKARGTSKAKDFLFICSFFHEAMEWVPWWVFFSISTGWAWLVRPYPQWSSWMNLVSRMTNLECPFTQGTLSIDFLIYSELVFTVRIWVFTQCRSASKHSCGRGPKRLRYIELNSDFFVDGQKFKLDAFFHERFNPLFGSISFGISPVILLISSLVCNHHLVITCV